MPIENFYTKILLFLQVTRALFIRDIKDKVFEHGVLFLFSPLLIQIAIQLFVYYVLKRQTIMGMHKMLFIVSSFMPFLLFEKTLMENAFVFMNIKSSLAIKQVKVFDAVIANCFSWFIITLFVFFVSLFIIYFIVQDYFEIYDVYNILYVFVIIFFLSLGLSMVVAVFGAYVKNAFMYTMFFTRIFYLISGIFFPLEAVPYEYRKYLLLNPLLHLTELSRYAFVPTMVRENVDFEYPILLMLVSLFIGFAMYLYFKDAFLKKAFE